MERAIVLIGLGSTVVYLRNSRLWEIHPGFIHCQGPKEQTTTNFVLLFFRHGWQTTNRRQLGSYYFVAVVGGNYRPTVLRNYERPNAKRLLYHSWIVERL